jgi:4,5-dihydroxyphthalate decarboxylase
LDSLLDGDVDAAIAAIIAPRSLEAFQADRRVKRLFPDYMLEDERLHQETGMFTAVRVLAMSKTLDRAHPGLARKLYDAFDAAKELAYKETIAQGTASALLYYRERMLEQKQRWGDPFKYGIAGNRTMIDTFLEYNLQQGLIRSPLSYEQIFAPSTLDT